MKTLIFDCGGVIVYPRMGEWSLPLGAAKILEERARDLHTSKYLLAHRACASWLDEAQLVPTVEDERRLRREYFRAMGLRLDWHLNVRELDALADDFTDNIDRYGFFDDNRPFLSRWKKQGFRLGMLSDAMPSILKFMEQKDLLELFDAAVISTQVGAIKPDPRMYAAILRAMDAEPGECLFVDDRLSNLEGAEAAGMRAVQMSRVEFPATELWSGPIVRDFEALDRLLEAGI